MDTRNSGHPSPCSDCRYRFAPVTWQSQNSRSISSQASSMKKIVADPPIAFATSRTTFPCPLAPHNTKSAISPHLRCAPHELRHRGMTRLADAISPHQSQHREVQDFGIEPEALMIHVPNVQLELLLPGEVVSSVHLRPSSDARLHLVATALESRVSGQVFGKQRSRADQAHIPLEHVPELRQFIEAGAAKEFSQRGQPLLVGQQFPILVAGFDHRAELIKGEYAAILAHSRLHEQRAAP